MGKDDLVVDVTVRHDFIGDARDVLRHGTLRNPDRPDQLLDQAAADKIRNYREPYAGCLARARRRISGRWRVRLAPGAPVRVAAAARGAQRRHGRPRKLRNHATRGPCM